MVAPMVHANWLRSRKRLPPPPGPAAMLRAHRERKGLTIVAVAARCAIDQADISRLERGKLGEGRSILSRRMIEEIGKGLALTDAELAPILIAAGYIPTGYTCVPIDNGGGNA